MRITAKLTAALGLLVWPLAPARSATPPHEVLWDTQVVPVLDRYCFKCHAGVRQKSGLDLRSLDTILRGGEQGPEVIPGKPEQSRLLAVLNPEADPHMPPEGKKQLTPPEIESLRNWITILPSSIDPRCSDTNTGWIAGYLERLRTMEKPAQAPPDSTSPSAAIDSILQTDWAEQNITPAPLCDDRTFLRRVYLDLAGRIPTENEVQNSLLGPNGLSRDALIDRLLQSPEYSHRLRDVFDVILLGRPKGRNVTARGEHRWLAYLENSFAANRPWNEMVREMVLARSTNGAARGASQFLYERKNNYQAMAEAVAPVAFGMQIGCAQCHNHPLSWEVEQRHYWGLVAAFNRSKNVDTPAGIALSESAIGGFVTFANLKKESQPAALSFLNGKTIQEHPPGENEKESDDPALYLIPPSKETPKEEKGTLKMNTAAVPKFSRREALAEAITTDNPRLARAFVNRMWQILMGRGIVHPVDQMDSRHRPSHPLLLDWLATDFEHHGYDVKRLIRAIVRSRAYQLDSKGGRSAPPPASFALALDKPLSAEQLAASLLVATGNYPAADERTAEVRQAMIQKFPDFMPVVYNPSLEQALFWANSPTIDSLLQPQKTNTTALLQTIESAESRIEKAFILVLGREPERAEMDEMKSLGVSGGSENAIKNVLWALLSSAEFQLNH